MYYQLIELINPLIYTAYYGLIICLPPNKITSLFIKINDTFCASPLNKITCSTFLTSPEETNYILSFNTVCKVHHKILLGINWTLHILLTYSLHIILIVSNKIVWSNEVGVTFR